MRHYLLLLFVVVFISCSSETQKKEKEDIPKRTDIHSKSELAEIMTQFFLAEAITHKSIQDGKNMYTAMNQSYSYIFSKYHTSYELVKQSMEYYGKRNELEEILDNVINILTEEDIKLKNN